MEETFNELSTEHWERVLREAREMGAVQLGFSGGEPLLRKDLEHLVAYAQALGLHQFDHLWHRHDRKTYCQTQRSRP